MENNVAVVEKVLGAEGYTNRIAKYLDPITNNGGISNNNTAVKQSHGGESCKTCQYQGQGWCRRYPARVYVKTGDEYFEACGEYKSNA